MKTRQTDNFEYGHFTKLSISGVYCIRCKTNGLEYIGSSFDIGKRLTKHFSELRFNRHRNKKLQEDFNNYSFDDFEYFVIEETEHYAKREVEIQIAKATENGIESLYNEKIEGYYITEELRQARATSNKDTHKTDEYRKKMSELKSNKLIQLTRNGDVVAIYNNMTEVIEKNPTFKAQPIRGVCNGSKKTAYDYKWEYIKD